MGDSEEECVQNVKSSLILFKSLGSTRSSVLISSHKITYLGFEIDPQSITAVSTLEKRERGEGGRDRKTGKERD